MTEGVGIFQVACRLSISMKTSTNWVCAAEVGKLERTGRHRRPRTESERSRRGSSGKLVKVKIAHALLNHARPILRRRRDEVRRRLSRSDRTVWWRRCAGCFWLRSAVTARSAVSQFRVRSESDHRLGALNDRCRPERKSGWSYVKSCQPDQAHPRSVRHARNEAISRNDMDQA
jgi:hypothetical protein